MRHRLYRRFANLIPDNLRRELSNEIHLVSDRLRKRTHFEHTYANTLVLSVLFESPDLRFLLSLGFPSHNEPAMPYMQKRDILFCIVPCYIDAFRLRRELQTLPLFGLTTDQVILLCNSEEDTILAREVGFQSEYINQNCWVDESLFNPDSTIEKDLDAVLICSPLPLKRATLAAGLKNLAIVTHTPYPRGLRDTISPSEYHERISASEVAQIINRARVGLCLSPFEGACYAASEYLLCGVPIVSTLSRGGR